MDLPSIVVSSASAAILAAIGWFGRRELLNVEARMSDLEDDLEQTQEELQLRVIEMTKQQSKLEQIADLVFRLEGSLERINEKLDTLKDSLKH